MTWQSFSPKLDRKSVRKMKSSAKARGNRARHQLQCVEFIIYMCWLSECGSSATNRFRVWHGAFAIPLDDCVSRSGDRSIAGREKHLNKFTGARVHDRHENRTNGKSDDQLKLFLSSFLIKSSVFFFRRTELWTWAVCGAQYFCEWTQALANTHFTVIVFRSDVPTLRKSYECACDAQLMDAVELSTWYWGDADWWRHSTTLAAWTLNGVWERTRIRVR